MERVHDGDVAINGDNTHMLVSDVYEPASDRSKDGLVHLRVAWHPTSRQVNEIVGERDWQQHVAGGHTGRQGVGFDAKARSDSDGIQRHNVGEKYHAHKDKTDRSSCDEQRVGERTNITGAPSGHRKRLVAADSLIRVVACRGVDARHFSNSEMCRLISNAMF